MSAAPNSLDVERRLAKFRGLYEPVGLVMQRRLFAYLSLAWSASASFLSSPGSAAEQPDRLPALLVQLTPEQSTARQMGEAYLAVAEKGRLATTVAKLRGSCGEGVPGLRQAVAALAREDFTRGETVLVDGWVLARAEAETLALIAIHAARSC